MTSIAQPEGFIKGVFLESWDEFKKNAVTHVIAALILVIVGAITFGLLFAPLTVGYLEMVRKSRKGEAIAFGDIFSGFSKIVTSFVTGLIIAVAVGIGMVLLVLPGVVVMLLWSFPFHFMAYENAGIGDSLSGSFNLVKANFLNILVLFVALAVLNTVASMVVVATLVTLPLSLIASAVAFEHLRGAK